jgi:hypothetical protein
MSLLQKSLHQREVETEVLAMKKSEERAEEVA